MKQGEKATNFKTKHSTDTAQMRKTMFVKFKSNFATTVLISKKRPELD